MTQNNTAAPLDLLEWIQAHQEEIDCHTAWHPQIFDSIAAEALLKNKAPFTYLLRAADKILSYFISFVKPDGSIKHQFFVLEPTQQGWRYRNGACDQFFAGARFTSSIKDSSTEIIAECLHEIIPMMMHCNPEDGHPLKPFCK